MLLTLSLLFLAAGQAGSTTAQPQPAKDKMICKRETPVGSLIASRKVCLTKTQWEQRSDDGNEAARRMMMDNMGRPSCTNGSC